MSEENKSSEELEITSSSESKEEEATSLDKAQSAVKKLADQKPEKFMEMMSLEMMGSIGNPLHQKITPEHISQVLDLSAKHDERQYDLHKKSQDNDFSEGKANRAYFFAVFSVVVILVVIVLFLFEDKPDVLIPVLTGLGGFASGVLGGWGLGKSQK